MEVQASGSGLLPDITVSLDGGLGEVDVEDAVGGMTNGLAHAPRTFDEEAPVLGPRIAAG